MKTILRICSVLLFLFVAGLCVPSSQAAVITVAITGNLTGSLAGNSFDNQPFQWSLTYDPAVILEGQQIFLNPVSVITVGGNPLNVTQDHGLWVNYDASYFFLAPVQMTNTLGVWSSGYDLLRVEGTLPWAGITEPYTSSSITAVTFYNPDTVPISTDQGTLLMFSGDVSSVAATPEPSSLALLAVAGVALLAVFLRKRSA